MSAVKRFNAIDNKSNVHLCMKSDGEGHYVLASDHDNAVAGLNQKIEILTQQTSVANSMIETIVKLRAEMAKRDERIAVLEAVLSKLGDERVAMGSPLTRLIARAALQSAEKEG